MNDLPKVGETWRVLRPGASALCALRILSLTAKCAEVVDDSHLWNAPQWIVLDDHRFVERVMDSELCVKRAVSDAVKAAEESVRPKALYSKRVVCAAVRAADGSVMVGIRHYDETMYRQISARTDGGKFCHRNGDDQGFVDANGFYMTRSEALYVARSAGQIIRPAEFESDKLYSEMLY